MSKPDRSSVLILDNEPSIVRAIEYRLKQYGYRCLTAIRGMEAMAHCTQNHVDLIITDLRMPGLDGEGFVSMVRSVSRVPIIVATGCSLPRRAHLTAYGELDVVLKPFEFEQLQQLIERRLNQSISRQKERLTYVR